VVSSGDHLLVTDSGLWTDPAFLRHDVEAAGRRDQLLSAHRRYRAFAQAHTKAVFCESPGSLTFEIRTIPAIARAAHAKGASVLMDNTWRRRVCSTPMAMVWTSRSKPAPNIWGGHADVNIGTVSANEAHAQQLKETHGNMGLAASGDDCFLALRGLRTLAVRLKRHQETALKLTAWLAKRPEVAR